MRRHAVAMAVGLVALLLGLSLRIFDPVIISQARLAVFDTYQRLAPRAYQPAPVRVIDIDDESMRRLGQWPWPRTLVAELVDRLTALGAAAIAFDIVFAEPDRTSPAQILPLWPDNPTLDALRASVEEMPDHDQLLAEAIARSPVVLGFAAVNAPTERLPARKGGLAFAGSDPRDIVQSFSGAVTNLPILEAAAAGNGSFSLSGQAGGVIRRIPLIQTVGGEVLPSLSIEALRVAQGASTIVTRASDASGEIAFGDTVGLNAIQVGALILPTTADGQFWVHYTETVPERMLPAWRLLDPAADPQEIADLLAGHIVLIGTSAQGLQDVRSTPLRAFEPGVLVHAQALEQMILGDFLERPDYAAGAELVFILVLGLVLVVLLPRLGALWCAVIGAGAIAFAVGGSWAAFTRADLLFDPLYPSIATLIVYLSVSLTVFLRTEREKGRVRGAFSRYLSPTLVDRLAEHPDQLVLGGEMRQMTLLFCDIRGFTTISESMGPQELTSFINSFLTPMTDIILASGGTIDKYMGDAIMAFWNAPLADPDHARHGCEAALRMIRDLNALNETWRREADRLGRAFPGIAIGIGLNSGEACVGNMGSDQRFDYSVLGDTVNLASRLEGQSKLYGVPIVIGEATRAAVPDLPALELDLIRVKGKHRPVRIYALVVDDQQVAPDLLATLGDRHAAMLDAYRSRRWDEAEALIARCREIAGDGLDELYRLYADRIAHCRADPPPPDWDAVYVAETK